MTWQACSSFLAQWLHCWTHSLVGHTIVELALLTSSAVSPRNIQECKWLIIHIEAPAFMLLWKLFPQALYTFYFIYFFFWHYDIRAPVQCLLMLVEKLLTWWALDYSWVAYCAIASCGRWHTLPVTTSFSKWVILGCSKWLRGDLSDDYINCSVCWEQKLQLSCRFCLSGVLLIQVGFLKSFFIKTKLKRHFSRRLFRG